MPGKLAILRLKGSPRQIGYAHGEHAQDKIQHNIQVYFRRFKNETQLSKDEALKRAEKYLRVIRRTSPGYAETMEGVAMGSKAKLSEIAALNVRYELMYSQFAKIGLKPTPNPGGCTAFGALPDATMNHHLLMAQNWDWIPQVKGLFLKVHPNTGPDMLCFTEAGVVGGKIGMNSNGIGLAINGLVSNKDNWERLRKPFHVRCWEILQSKTLSEAVSKVTRGERSCSANFLIGQQSSLGASKLVDVESSPKTTITFAPENGILSHTNHFTRPEKLGVKQVLDDERWSTMHRYERIRDLLGEVRNGHVKLNLSKAEEMLRDHDGKPESVCRHPNPRFPEDERYQSVVSVVMDLYTSHLRATMGSPCENQYQTLRL